MFRKKREEVVLPQNNLSDEEIGYIKSIIEQFSTLDFSRDFSSQKEDSYGFIKGLSDIQKAVGSMISEIMVSNHSMEQSCSEMDHKSKSIRDQMIHIDEFTESIKNSSTEMNSNLSTVSSATEEMSVNMQSISTASTVSRDHVSQISDNTQELTSAAQEIAISTEKATAISSRALSQAAETSQKVSLLEEAAKEIDVVTATISEISDQTKLLALNATIEAARAGEAGKGFAVVAKEVKDLALQTNEATKDIQQKIAVIQNATIEATKAIASIGEVIREVNDVVTTIAAASEEQSVTTANIADSIQETTNRIDDMSTNVEQGADAVQDVNVSIADSVGFSHEVAQSISNLSSESNKTVDDSISNYASVLETVAHSTEIKDVLSTVTIITSEREKSNHVRSELCRFTQSWDVHVEQYNDAHKKIFAYINDIHRQIKENDSSQKILTTIKNLEEFTIQHFADEEQTFIATQYPEYSQHKQIHETLLAEIRSIVEKLENGEAVDLIEVMVFLKKWLIDHIKGVDMRYGSHLNKHGIR